MSKPKQSAAQIVVYNMSGERLPPKLLSQLQAAVQLVIKDHQNIAYTTVVE